MTLPVIRATGTEVIDLLPWSLRVVLLAEATARR